MEVATRLTHMTIEGEVLARELRHSPDFSEEQYFGLIRRKTGALMSLASLSGPMLTNASEGHAEAMRRYGEQLGMGFQIIDDVLDVEGDPAIVGKPTGQDLRDGLITLPLIRALSNASESESSSVSMSTLSMPFLLPCPPGRP